MVPSMGMYRTTTRDFLGRPMGFRGLLKKWEVTTDGVDARLDPLYRLGFLFLRILTYRFYSIKRMAQCPRKHVF
jgi:hypothetical protein